MKSSTLAVTPVLAVATLLAWGSSPALGQSQPASACRCSLSEKTVRCYRSGTWFVAESENFQVCSQDSEATVRHATARAESVRKKLADKWFGSDVASSWNPRCQVVLFSSRSSYCAAVGPGSNGTRGSSAVGFDKDRIVSRRIDLLNLDGDGLDEALPHEMTHVLLKDRFTSATLPRWADEGLAMLADSQHKQLGHIRDLHKALSAGTEFTAADLLSMRDYPRADRRQAFYGQSILLAKVLVARKSESQLVHFLGRAAKVGTDCALKECYGISGVAELDRIWRRELYSGQIAAL